MIGEYRTEKDSEGNGGNIIEVISRHLHGRKGENHEKTVRIPGAEAEIRTEQLPNTIKSVTGT
jgi:hypothetical protein